MTINTSFDDYSDDLFFLDDDLLLGGEIEDSVDLDEDKAQPDPLFYASLISQTEERALQLFQSDARLHALFKKSLGQMPNEKPLATKMAQIAVKLLHPYELPHWVRSFSFPQELLSLVEIVRLGRADLLETYETLDAADWLSYRSDLGESLLHLALQGGHYEIATHLVEKCPALLLAKSVQGKYALDLLPENRDLAPYVETLLAPYSGTTDQPEVDAWRQLAALCYLKSPFWVNTFAAKQRELLLKLDPRGVREEPIHYHPLLICEKLEKSQTANQLLTYCCSRVDLKIAWSCLAGAGSLASALEQPALWASPPSPRPPQGPDAGAFQPQPFPLRVAGAFPPPPEPWGAFQPQPRPIQPLNPQPFPLHQPLHFMAAANALPPYVLEHPVSKKMLVRSLHPDLRDFTTALLFHEGYEEQALKRVGLDYMHCIRAAPDSPHTQRLWEEHFSQKPAAALQKIGEILQYNYHKSLSPAGLAFILKHFKAALGEESVQDVDPQTLLPLFFHIEDPELAAQFFSIFKWHSSLSDWCSKLLETFRDQKSAWFKQLTEIGKQFLPISLTPQAVLSHILSSSGCHTALSLLSEVAPQQLAAALHQKNGNDTPFVQFLKQGWLDSKTVDILTKDLDWKRRETVNGQPVSLRCYALFFCDAHLLEKLSSTGPWLLKDLKEIVDLIPHVDGMTSLGAKQILTLLGAEPQLLNEENLLKLISNLLKLKREREESVLSLLEPIFARQPLPSYRKFLELSALSVSDFRWLRKKGMALPNYRELESDLLVKRVPPALRSFWGEEVCQGVTANPNKKFPAVASSTNLSEKTWQQLHGDPRFRKIDGKNVAFGNYRITRQPKAKVMDIYAGERLVVAGTYTLERLVHIIEEDMVATELHLLLSQDIRPHFSDLAVTIVAANPLHIQAIQTPVYLIKAFTGLHAHYFDPSNGAQKQKNFPWSPTCIEEVRQFVIAHNQLIQQKFEQLQAAISPWSCLWLGGEPRESPIIVGKRGNETILVYLLKEKSQTRLVQKFKGILSPEMAKREIEKCEAFVQFQRSMSEIFGSSHEFQFGDLFHTKIEKIRSTREITGIVILFQNPTDSLLVTKDLINPDRLFFIPSSPDKGQTLRLVKDELSGSELNSNLTKTVEWQQGAELIHEAPAPVELFQLIQILENQKETPYLKQYLAQHHCSSEGMKANLERFLKAVQNRNIQGFIPFEKYEKEYRKLEIQLTHTFQQLLDNPESLSWFVCELAYHAQYCGPKIAETVQFLYSTTFNLLQEGEMLQGGIELRLKNAYGRAILESLEEFLKWIGNEVDKRQTIHVLSYLRKTLKEAGYALPPDSRIGETQDRWDQAFGKKDFPQDQFPSWFQGMVIPQLVEVLSAMQKEAREAKDHDFGALLLNSIRECVLTYAHRPEIVDLSENIALIESEKEALLPLQYSQKADLIAQRETLYQRYQESWQRYNETLQHLNGLDGKIRALSDRLLELQQEYSSLEEEGPSAKASVGQKRTHAQLIASENAFLSNQEVLAARKIRIGDEMKRAHQQRGNLETEQSCLAGLLEQVKGGDLKEIFELELKIRATEDKIQEISLKASERISAEKDRACETLGWTEEDELCITTVSKKGLIALLKQHHYLIPGAELQRMQYGYEELRDFIV